MEAGDMENEVAAEASAHRSLVYVEASVPVDDVADAHESSTDAPAEKAIFYVPLETPETGDVRVDAAIARLSECSSDDDPAAIAVLTDVYDRLHHVLLNP